MRRFYPYRLLLLLPLLLALNGCLFRSRKVEPRVTRGDLRQATKQELVERINAQAQKVQTLNATVDMAASVGGARRGKVTEYQEIRGYLLVRKPQMIRMIGLFPIVRNRAFDMVSDGQTFRLSIPSKNRFITGRNQITTPSDKPLENLRPQHIFDALLLDPIDPGNEIAVLEAGAEVVREVGSKRELLEPNYIVVVIRRGPDGAWALSRKIIFNRTELQPERQIVYDKLGNVATDAIYREFSEHDGVVFPSVIHIVRPQEEYAIDLKIVKLRVNEPLKDEQFVLKQPEGAEVVKLDAAGDPRAADGNPRP